MDDVRELIYQSQLAVFIVGDRNKSRRPEEDTARWNNLIDFYHHHATVHEKQYIGNLLITMFESHRKEEQLPALMISRVIKLPAMRDELIRFIQEGNFGNLNEYVQRSILIAITAFQIDGLSSFLLDTLTQKRMVKNFITWSDAPSAEDTMTDHDFWRIELLAQYFELSSQTVREDITRQLMSIPKGHKKTGTILIAFFALAEKYPHFREEISAFLTKP